MHRCPTCSAICYCDFDDTDYGDEPLDGICHHECIELDDDYFDDDYFDDDDDLIPDEPPEDA